jgi:large subunit ribosomal protein L24
MSRSPKIRIKTGDQVQVITGKDAGKKGKVLQVFPREHRLVVEGVNSMTKNIRPRQRGDEGQRVQFNGPIDASNVMLVDPKSNQPTRIGTMKVGDKKVRRAVTSQQPLA